MQEAVQLASPMLQYGFGGLCVIQMGVFCWLISKMLPILLQMLTAINGLQKDVNEVKKLAIKNKDLLNSKPCIALGREEETD